VAPVEKKAAKGFFGLFGGSNPFLKPSKMSKSLIATPSKFEIKSHSTKKAAVKVTAKAEKKPTGVRGKLAAAKKAAAPKTSKSSPKVSAKSKQISKANEIKKALKARVKAKKMEVLRKAKEAK